MPVFGGWLRNIEDEQMDATWGYVKKLTQRSEALGTHLTLIAERNSTISRGHSALRMPVPRPRRWRRCRGKSK